MKDREKLKTAMIVYNPFPNDSRVRKEAIFLQKTGFKVTVFCLRFPNEKKRDFFNGVLIKRIFPVLSFETRQKFVNLVLFWFFTFFEIRKNKYLIVHAHDPTALPPALAYKLFNYKTEIIYDSHELFPENAFEVVGFYGMILAMFLEFISSFFINQVITVSPDIAIYLAKRYNLKKVSYLLNSPTFKELDFLLSQKKSKDTIKIVYAGIIQPHRGYHELLEAVLYLKHLKLPPFKIIIVGDGPILTLLKDFAKRNDIGNMVDFKGLLDFENYLKIVGSSHIGLILFKGKCYQSLSVPARGYEYIFSNLIVVYNDSLSGSAKRILQKHVTKCIEVDSKSVKSIAEGIKKGLSYIQVQKSKDYVSKDHKRRIQHLAWDNQIERLISIYKSILKDDIFKMSDKKQKLKDINESTYIK